jgi:uracil-DNA glycosylase
MDVKIEETWKKVLEEEFGKEYFVKLTEFVKSEYNKNTVYPPPGFIFKAFELTPFDKVKVVILGQDPYHGPGQANGLAFAVNEGIKLPPSLVNIYKEVKSDTGKMTVNSGGDLEKWASQGILLLNATLTVRAHTAGSHQNKGWENFTDAVVKILSEKKRVWYLYSGEVMLKKRTSN